VTFTPLRVRSHGTLLAGVASPEALAEQAAALGYGALALTDRDNLYLAVRFLQAGAAAGVRALPGAELTARDARPGERVPRVLLLPFDRRGWASLCALLTARMLEPEFDLVRALGAQHAGLQVIAESPALLAALLAAGVPPAVRAADLPRTPRPRRGGLWLGVRGLAAERVALRARLAEAWRLGVPAVATGDVWLLAPGDHEAHRVAVTAAAGERLERMPAAAFASREAVLEPPAAWERRVRAVCGGAGCAEAADTLLAENTALTERTHATLELGTPIFPQAPLPPGVAPAAELRRLAEAGLGRRWPGARATPATRAAARARLETELDLIARMGFTDYFLLVAAIVGFARDRGIPTVGRGSGASSLVAYALGVTSVDPLRYGLCFERFLHPQRRDCPDLDIDLCWERRDEVIACVYDAYGHDRVAMIATHATLGPRSAFREAAKALGLPLPRVDALARRVPRDLHASALEDALAGPRTRWGRSSPSRGCARRCGSRRGSPARRATSASTAAAWSSPTVRSPTTSRSSAAPRAWSCRSSRCARSRRSAWSRWTCSATARSAPSPSAMRSPPATRMRLPRGATTAPRRRRRWTRWTRTMPSPPRWWHGATPSTASSSSRRRCGTCCGCCGRGPSTTRWRRWRWCGRAPRSRG
jgi:DNA polymerase III alpha subunit